MLASHAKKITELNRPVAMDAIYLKIKERAFKGYSNYYRCHLSESQISKLEELGYIVKFYPGVGDVNSRLTVLDGSYSISW